MYHRWAALALVLALCALPAKQAAGQQTSPQPSRKAGVLGQNYPNPFNPETTIPFGIECDGNASRQYTVSLQVYNVLSQLVAIPILDGPGTPTENLKLTCGKYTARWDGKIRSTGREAASGVYVYVLKVDGVPSANRMFVAK
ncbi:MAG: hypothetical protein V4550_12855 [Gemmatimonadota bacterium]